MRDTIQKVKPEFAAMAVGKHSCGFCPTHAIGLEDKSAVANSTEISNLNNAHTKVIIQNYKLTAQASPCYSFFSAFSSLYCISKSPAHTSGWDLTVPCTYNSSHPKICKAPRDWKEKCVKLFWTPISERYQWAYEWKRNSGKPEKLIHKRCECWQDGQYETHGRSMGLQFGITMRIFRGTNIRG